MNEEEWRVILEEVGKRVPGAMQVLCELRAYFVTEYLFQIVDVLKRENIRGADLWCLFVCCSHNIELLYMSLLQNTAIQKLQAVPDSSFYQEVKKD